MSERLIQIASSNPGKLAEIMLGVELWRRRKFQLPADRFDAQFELLPDFSHLPQCIEDADTFAGNARKKALHYSRLTKSPGAWVLSDDSGLVVDALGGAPGIFSARYAGPHATDQQNNEKLLGELRATPEEERTACFVCVLALASKGTLIDEFSGEAPGLIVESARGTKGYGYDPLFLDIFSNKTYAELTAEEKMTRSHRGEALFALLDWLASKPRP